MRFFNRKGQSTLEYAVLIAGVVGAILIFAPYLQRVAQGRFKESSDRIGYKFGGTNSTSINQSYTTSWEEKGSGTSAVTTETYNSNSGTTASNTATGETVTRAEAESWGNSSDLKYINE